jgi:hypothetical protein
MTHFQLSTEQAVRARALIDPALEFLQERHFPLGTALVRHHWGDACASDVLAELSSYQNEDGGFGRGLEVDIKSPASNPFAARLAMAGMLSLRDRPASLVIERLGAWLRDNQHVDGDWHFSEAVYAGELPPWFTAWTFPSLNPACCVAGHANRHGIATPEMLERVARLFAAEASPEDAASGEFYTVLPYVEYLGGVDAVPDRATWLDAVGQNVAGHGEGDGFADAGHFFELALGGGPELVQRIPAETLSRQADRLMAEVEADGGWPSAYDDAWRPSLTASALTMLAMLRDGV